MKQFGNPEVRLYLWWFCRGCSHYTIALEGTCVWCGSNQTGLALGDGPLSIWSKGLGKSLVNQVNSATMEHPAVDRQLNYGMGYRLAKGFALMEGRTQV